MKSRVSSFELVNRRIGILILEPGDELHDSVRRFAKTNDFRGGFVTGIGAVDDVELGYFRLPEKVYDRKRYPERLEVVSLTGNLAVKDGEPFLHVHGVFSGPEFRTVGGHVFSAKVSITLEVVIMESSPLTRVDDPTFGLTRIDPYCEA